ncbi:MAG TPA: SOS response-associated peptidase [Pyrinomonadaceae bacterium]|jgi:putative SOS response-associated peptidase YedK|nr:SOS response-associated peptidase [Pyrinomonadaceae bacterium]
MCGRFTLRSVDRIRLALGDRINLEYIPPRYNIAPTQPVIALTSLDHAEELVWGLRPNWSKEPKAVINARAETLDDKASFSDSFQKRRCLILADGFYEWRRVGKAKQAFFFQMKDERAFAFAGLWDRWKSGGETIKSCAIVTTAANKLLLPVHDRMPVILPEQAYRLWLDIEVNPNELKKLLEPFPSEEMKSYPVSSKVNFTDNDGEELVERVDVEVGATPSLF